MSLKKSNKNRFTLTRGLMLVFLVLAFTTTVQVKLVHAAPLTLDVFPSSAPVGSIVALFGINATASGEVRIYVFSLFFASTTANTTGGYSVNVTIPAVPAGSYPIMALDVESGDTASNSFGVEPRILLTPSEGSYDTVVSIRGEGFNSDTDITLTFDGTDVTPLPAPHTDFLGSFSAEFNVPMEPNGTYTVTATDPWSTTASESFRVLPTIFVYPVSMNRNPGNLAFVEGYGFGVSLNVTMRFGSVDVTVYPIVTTDFLGYFSMPFFIPNLPRGIYTVNASDTQGNSAAVQFPVGDPILKLTPDRTFESSIVKAVGTGFMPRASILLYLEDITVTNVADLWMSTNVAADNYGNFDYSFVVPVTKPGTYSVTAYMMLGPPPAEMQKVASANLTIIDDSPLDTVVNVGSMHFRGELAEFYVETALNGKPVNSTIRKATLYYLNGTQKVDFTSSVGKVATGLYRIAYAVPGDAPFGTYNLLVEANYTSLWIEAYGTSSANFLLSAGFTNQNARLIDVQGKIGTIVIPDLGTIIANLTTINATLTSVEGRELTIQSDIGTLKTDADTIRAQLIAIDGETATIQSDIGTLLADISDINAKVDSIDGNTATFSSDLGSIKSQVVAADPQISLATLALSMVAAAGAILALLSIRRLKPPAPSPAASTTPAPDSPPPPATAEISPTIDTPKMSTEPTQAQNTEPNEPSSTEETQTSDSPSSEPPTA